MVPTMPVPPRSAQIVADTAGPTVTIFVSGELDADAGRALLDAVRHELENGPARIDIDLGNLVSFDDDGTAALAECRALSGGLVEGLHYRTEGGAGQAALLTAFADGPN